MASGRYSRSSAPDKEKECFYNELSYVLVEWQSYCFTSDQLYMCGESPRHGIYEVGVP